VFPSTKASGSWFEDLLQPTPKNGGSVVNTTLPCRFCASEKVGNFLGEIAIHFSGLADVAKPHVWVFPELVVCFDCGNAQFAIPEVELRQLAEGREAGAERPKRS